MLAPLKIILKHRVDSVFPPQKLHEKKPCAIWVDDQGFTMNEEMQRFST